MHVKEKKKLWKKIPVRIFFLKIPQFFFSLRKVQQQKLWIFGVVKSAKNIFFHMDGFKF